MGSTLSDHSLEEGQGVPDRLCHTLSSSRGALRFLVFGFRCLLSEQRSFLFVWLITSRVMLSIMAAVKLGEPITAMARALRSL